MVTFSEIEHRIKPIIKNQLKIDDSKLTLDANFISDLGADSLAIVKMIVAIEDEFDIEISDDDNDKIITIKDAVEYILDLKEVK